jgi:hypothetical protein
VLALGFVPPIAVYAQCGNIDAARVHFDEAPRPEQKIAAEIGVRQRGAGNNRCYFLKGCMRMDVDDRRSLAADAYLFTSLR